MSQMIEVKVPDIGDFKDVPVIEVHVKPGDSIKVDDALVTLESDKATMDVPSSAAGVVASVAVKLGDRVSQGTVVVLLESRVESGESRATLTPAGKVASSSSLASSGADSNSTRSAAAIEDNSRPSTLDSRPGSPLSTLDSRLNCQMLVLGAGPGGYSAAFRAADLGMKVILVERYATLGGVCLNVGCIPSKALLHVTTVMDEAAALAHHGVSFGTPSVDLEKLRAFKSGVVGKLTKGLAGMAKARKVTVLQGVGRFLDSHHLAVQTANGEEVVRFEQAIIAAGSQAVKLPFLPEDPRVIDSTGALELRAVPKRMLVIGGGIIGMEMATVYSTLGARIDVVEMLDGLMQGADRDLVKVWQKMNSRRFDRIMLKTRTTKAEATPEGIRVSFEGEEAPAEPQVYDLVLVSAGRSPNGNKIGAENAGVAVTDRGFIPVDTQMRTNLPHIFAIGDIVGQPMLAHKAVHEAHAAAEAAAGHKAHFDARVIPAVAYTDPEISWVGITEDEAKKQGLKVEKSVFPWAASGRAIANGRDEGFTKLLFDAETHRVVGAGIVGTHAGDLIGELALAVEMGCDPVDLGKTIHPHPTLCESVGMAAEVFEGVCTDLPPQKKR